MEKTQILKNYLEVKNKVIKAAEAAGRDPEAIKVLVVTKGHPLAVVQEAFAAGIRVFGENYVEEGIEKLQAMESADIEWHMIGHLQSRKASQVCQFFDVLHSLDSEKLARRLDRFSAGFQRKLPVFLECNVSGEASKFGIPAWNKSSWDDLVIRIQSIIEFSHLDLRGLMTMAPYSLQPENSRLYFRRLHELSQFLAQHIPGQGFRELSMGMSGDYEIAVAEGATIVRIGTAILGARPEL